MGDIVIRGARQHNLKNIDLTLPRNRLVVFTGLSGSGKSSLAFDTIYAEGQRRYVESLSAYARQFLGQMDKPDVDSIDGLSPAISIDQKSTSHNPRSTVGTVTEIYDYLRLLYARVGHPHCPRCGRPIDRQSVDQMVNQLLTLPEGSKVEILAPWIRGKKGEHHKVLEEIRRQGFVRVRVDGRIREIDEEIVLDRQKKHDLEAVVDRLILREGVRSRLTDSLETALKWGEGLAIAVTGTEEVLLSERLGCPVCGVSLAELSPRLFSFNSPYGACPTCTGLGVVQEADPELVIPDRTCSLEGGAILPWAGSPYYAEFLRVVALAHGFSTRAPVGEIPPAAWEILLQGGGKERYAFWGRRLPFPGILPYLQSRYAKGSDTERHEVEPFLTAHACPSCGGARLKPEVLAVTVGDSSIHDLTARPVEELRDFFAELRLSEREEAIAREIRKEIVARLSFLLNVGLGYLTLDRRAGSLSGGEAQRIRLATQIGSGLTGVLYVLDEPSIGLHQRDNRRLLETLKSLRDLGNTLIVVEHDEETMREADYLVDIGPGAGERGGTVVAVGTPAQVMANPASITGAYLVGRRSIPIPSERRAPAKFLEIRGASEHNLKDLDVRLPLGLLVGVTGVSGSGKSTLIYDILYKALAQKLSGSRERPGAYREIVGLEHLDKVVSVDQSPIGRTPRSNPATYTGAFDLVREIFALTPEARGRGYGPGRFSFNVKGGRCEACRGDGIIKIEMHFLPDIYVPCEVCGGRRYNRETLEVRYRGLSIAEILEMTVSEALEFFTAYHRLKRKLQTLSDVGLDYIRLGQPATTLSGGEAQRIKLATELSRRSTGRTLYLLDEPTTGLHSADIEHLLAVLQRLTTTGDTVVVIEHNLDVVKTCDYLLDLGPEGGSGGGQLVVAGTPEEIAGSPHSHTGRYLAPILGRPVVRHAEG